VTGWAAYKTIADAIRTRIADGEYAPGATLPSEAALCSEFHVSRNTIRRALDQLAPEGMIVTRPGRGRVVVESHVPTTASGPQYRRIADELRKQIETGTLQPGDALPSESALATQHGVARGTARQALTALEGAGLADTFHGKGRFVRRQ
jgi:DNA-binding GntR family transcriptional regulator